MEEELLVGSVGTSDRDREIQELLAQYDAPAYVRRARGLETALENLIAQCQRQREEWLAMPRLRVGQLTALAGHLSALTEWLAEGEKQVVEEWQRLLAPRLRVPLAATTNRKVLKSALRQAVESVERFNERWQIYLSRLDLSDINRLREGYNRYYLLEKECALRSSILARKGYRPLLPLNLGEIEERLPYLRIPVLIGY